MALPAGRHKTREQRLSIDAQQAGMPHCISLVLNQNNFPNLADHSVHRLSRLHELSHLLVPWRLFAVSHSCGSGVRKVSDKFPMQLAFVFDLTSSFVT